MQCSLDKIEENRRLAQQKLALKRLNSSSPLKENVTSTSSSSRSPKQFTFKPYEKTKPVQSFYNKPVNVITASCRLISDSRFAVDTSTFSTTAINVFKTIPSRYYNPNTKLWDFSIEHYKTVEEKMLALQPGVVFKGIPNFVLNACNIPKPNYLDLDLSCIDLELLNALMPFQEEGVCFGIDKEGRCLIADDMGLGKTFQALGIVSYFKEDWPVLIVTTASMKNVWEETIHKYLTSISVMHIQYMTTTRDYIGDSKILIVSHDMMTRSVDKLLQRNFGILIVDESHVLKNFKAKCTKAALSLAKKAKRVVLLSGTPALSRPSELYTQLSMLDERFFGSFFDYSRRYCDGKTTHFGWDASGKSNLQELEIILSKKFMIRRTKEDVLKALPNKKQQVVTLDVNLSQLSEDDRKCLNALSQQYNRKDQKGAEKHAALLTFFAETARIKIPSVCSYILQVLETEQKFLVFAHHQKMMDAIEQVLRNKNKKFIRIDGHTSSDQRKFFVDKFQHDDSYVCAVLSITAANAGITLTAANLVLFAELHWNPSILSQAESRAHRIGQEQQVVVKYLLAPGTADDSIWPLLQNKQKILGEAGLSKDNFDNVTVHKQSTDGAVSLNKGVTSANTLDITSYFKSPKKSENNSADLFEDGFDEAIGKMDVFDDGLDDVLANMDF